MHSHDHDLIAALAEGILAEELASTAEVEIAACPERSADLASQRLALETLGTMVPAAMTDAEASSLRRSVADALGLADVTASPTAKRTRRSPWPAIAIAAGLAGAITIVPVLGLITGGGDDASTAQTVAAAVQESADDALTEGDAFVDSTPEALETAPVESALGTAEAPPTPGATEAATTTTVALRAEEGPAGSDLAADGESAIREVFDAGPLAAYSAATEQIERSSLACSAEAEQQFGNEFLFLDVPASMEDRPVVLYAGADWSVLVAFDLADCSVVLTLP